VLNGVDDSLSSKETTSLPRWRLEALGAGAAQIIQVAVDEGWCLLVTADHGHTPFVADRKAGSSGLGQRFSAEACEGAVMFANGPLPRKPLYLLARFGAWLGQQRRGFHGGASIEEVAVPLAFLGRVRGEQEGRSRAPAWWWSTESVADEAPRADPHRAGPPQPQPGPPSAAMPAVVLDERLESLSQEEKVAVGLLQQNQSARLTAIAQHLKKSPMRASGFMQQLVRKVFELNCPCISVEVLPDGDRLYRYQNVDRGNR
ncbi:MAG TPA: hypothetical protein VG963_24240, partial [Polyangiaceae bacterium]|nr:hypothetical protein [Polyangiaceae bacterium]